MKQVPTLDIRRYHSDRDAFVAELGAAYREFGFCCISGHGIPRELIDGSYDAFQRFFALPTETKMKYHVPGSGGARGFSRAAASRARCLTASTIFTSASQVPSCPSLSPSGFAGGAR